MASDFQSLITNASRYMLDENFNRKVDASARMINPSNGRGNDIDLKAAEAEIFGFSDTPTQTLPQMTYSQPQQMNESTNGNGLNYNNLPPGISELFKEKPLINNELEMMIAGGGELPPMPKINVAENVQPRVNNVPGMTSSSNIDYSVIRALINDCLTEQLSKTPTLSGIKIGQGGTIQLYDTKGNLYEGVLKKKKRVK